MWAEALLHARILTCPHQRNGPLFGAHQSEELLTLGRYMMTDRGVLWVYSGVGMFGMLASA